MGSFSKKIERNFKSGPAYFLLKLLLPTKKVDAQTLKSLTPKTILLVKIHHKIGDLLLATPVLQALRERYPEARIDFCAGKYNAPAVLHNRFLNNVYILDKKKISSWVTTIGTLRRVRYELGIVASASSFSTTNALVSRLCRPSILIGYRAPYRGVPENRLVTSALLSYTIDPPGNSVNETHYNLGYITPLAVNVPNYDEVMHFNERERTFADTWFSTILPQGTQQRVGIHAGGTFSNRQWPASNFSSLVSMLLAYPNLQIILFNGKGEHATIETLLKNLDPEMVKKSVFPIPDCSFRELAALQSRCDLFIGNDTGTLHSAAASGCKAIGIYTATDPARWSPLNSRVTALKQPTVSEVITTAAAHLGRTFTNSNERKASL